MLRLSVRKQKTKKKVWWLKICTMNKFLWGYWKKIHFFISHNSLHFILGLIYYSRLTHKKSFCQVTAAWYNHKPDTQIITDFTDVWAAWEVAVIIRIGNRWTIHPQRKCLEVFPHFKHLLHVQYCMCANICIKIRLWFHIGNA